jgi:hypothetical protein
MISFSCNAPKTQTATIKTALWFVIAIFLLIASCSTTSLVYRNAEWYLQYKINTYTSFNAQQKKMISVQIADYMRWHRKNALPDYIKFLQNLNGAAQFDGRIQPGEITLLRTDLLDLYKRTLVPLVRPTADMLASLDDQQIQELDMNLTHELDEQKREQLDVTPAQYRDRRADRTVDFMEWLAGSLGRDQEAKVRQMSRELPFVADIYLQQRQVNQKRLMDVVRSHAGREKIAAILLSWILTPESTRLPQQQDTIESFQRATDEMIAQIHATLTAKQKEHIRKIISSYIDEMRAENLKATSNTRP